MSHIIIRILLWLLVQAFRYLAWRGRNTVDANFFLKFLEEEAAEIASGGKRRSCETAKPPESPTGPTDGS